MRNVNKVKAALGLLLVGVVLTGCVKENKLKTILLIGQSNMASWGDYAQVDEDKKSLLASNENYYYYQVRSGLLEKYRPILRSSEKYKKKFNHSGYETFGPSLDILFEGIKTFDEEKFLLIRHTVAGTSLHGSWNPLWSEDKASQIANELYPTKSQLYQETLKGIISAEELVYKKGYSGLDIIGVIIIGGAKDAMFEISTENYRENLTDLILTLRKDLLKPNLRVVIQPIEAIDNATKRIEEAQKYVVNSLKNVDFIQKSRNSEYNTYLNDNHLDYIGIQRLGKDAINSILLSPE